MKKSPINKETTFFIINLAFTLLIAIYSTIIVSKQEQKFQRELIDYQNKIEIKNTYTTISMDVNYGTSFMWTCFPFVVIHNEGDTNAKNVQVFVELLSINNNWQPYFQDTSQLQIISTEALPYEVETLKKEYYSNRLLTSPNVLTFKIDYILPGTSKIFYVRPSEKIVGFTEEKQVDLDVIYNKDYEKFGEFLHKYFSIARVRIEESCENCIVSKEQLVEFDISNLDGCDFIVNESVLLDDNSELLKGHLTYRYFLPKQDFLFGHELPPTIDVK